MASASTSALTAEELSDIVDYEKMGPKDADETYDMLLHTGIIMPEQTTTVPLGERGLQRHRRKKHRPLQYRPPHGMIALETSRGVSDRTDEASGPPQPLSASVSGVLPQGGATGEADHELEGDQAADDASQSGLSSITGIIDIHRTLARQLEQATAIADKEHQPCPFCSYVFSNVMFLVRHLKYRHGINLEMQLGIPQDAPREISLTSPQRLAIVNQEHPSLETCPVPGFVPAGSMGGIGERQNDTGRNEAGVIAETSASRLITKDRDGYELRKEQVSQQMDQMIRPTLAQVAPDNPPRQPIIVCDKCTRAFTTVEDLEQHQRIHNITKTFECEHCHKLFQNPCSLKKHTKLHTDGKIYACLHCDKSFAAAAYLKTHMRLHTKQKPFVCKHCGKAFAASGTLISHERIHINDKPYGCEFCGKRFRQGSHLNRHKIIHTNMKPHVCAKCNRAFADVANLRRHERIHNQDNPNVCSECGKSFINLSSLKKHERLHTNEKPYICRHCSKPFASSGNLISHERTHTNERPYICKECGKAFTQSSHLKAHMGTHSSDTLYVCKHCGRGFTQRSTLCVHERIHLNKKPYVCQVCERAFTQSSTLKAHIRTHTKEKAHICKVCGKAFSARGNLRSHELIHTDEKPFKCGSCPKAFKQGSTLRAHERTHTKERPYVCRACGKAFADGSNLKAHTLRIHSKGPRKDTGSDLLTSTLLEQSANECLDQAEPYLGSQLSELGPDPIVSESPVGIKIKKTLEGLTSILRFSKEVNGFPSSSSDHQSHPTSDEKSEDTKASVEDSTGTEPIKESPDPETIGRVPNNDKETGQSRTSLTSSKHDQTFPNDPRDYHNSQNIPASVLDLSTWSEGRAVEEQGKETAYGFSGSSTNLTSTRSCSQSVNQDSYVQEHNDDEFTFDEDDDLESFQTGSGENDSGEDSEPQLKQNNASRRSPSQFQRRPNLDFQNPGSRGTSRRTNLGSRANMTTLKMNPANTNAWLERPLHLEDKYRRGTANFIPKPEEHLRIVNGNGTSLADMTGRGVALVNSRSKEESAHNTEGISDYEGEEEDEDKEDEEEALPRGGPPFDTSKNKPKNSNSRQGLIEDLEISRILPLN